MSEAACAGGNLKPRLATAPSEPLAYGKQANRTVRIGGGKLTCIQDEVILRIPAERGAEERLKATFLQRPGHRQVPGYLGGRRVV